MSILLCYVPEEDTVSRRILSEIYSARHREMWDAIPSAALRGSKTTFDKKIGKYDAVFPNGEIISQFLSIYTLADGKKACIQMQFDISDEHFKLLNFEQYSQRISDIIKVSMQNYPGGRIDIGFLPDTAYQKSLAHPSSDSPPLPPQKRHPDEVNASLLNDVPQPSPDIPCAESATTQACTEVPTQVEFALGYDRPTFTNESPAPYAVFNSIINNAAVGDERNFVRIRQRVSGAKFQNEVVVESGKEYEVYIYYHNNAASNTNKSGYGMATDVRVAVDFPQHMDSNERATVSGAIIWGFVSREDNKAHTAKVSDVAHLVSKGSVALRYKEGTAMIHNGGEANGSVLSTKLFSRVGTHIGYNKLGGVLPGCAEYSGHITFTLIAE